MAYIDPELFRPNSFSEQMLEHIKSDFDLELSEDDWDELDDIVYGPHNSSYDDMDEAYTQ